MEFSTYTAPERSEGDTFKPSEHIGHLLIIRVNEHKHIESTQHKPDGGPGVIVDVCNLDDDAAVARDVLWMNGALVDGLRGYVGQHLVIKLAYEKSAKSGREYIVVKPATESDVERAKAQVAKGDPFAPSLSTPAPQSAQAPF